MFASSGRLSPALAPQLPPRSVTGGGSAEKVAQPWMEMTQNPGRVGEALSHLSRTTRSGDGASPMPLSIAAMQDDPSREGG